MKFTSCLIAGFLVAALFPAPARAQEPSCLSNWSATTGVGAMSVSTGQRCRLGITIGGVGSIQKVLLVKNAARGRVQVTGQAVFFQSQAGYKGKDSFQLEFFWSNARGDRRGVVTFDVTVD